MAGNLIQQPQEPQESLFRCSQCERDVPENHKCGYYCKDCKNVRDQVTRTAKRAGDPLKSWWSYMKARQPDEIKNVMADFSVRGQGKQGPRVLVLAEWRGRFPEPDEWRPAPDLDLPTVREVGAADPHGPEVVGNGAFRFHPKAAAGPPGPPGPPPLPPPADGRRYREESVLMKVKRHTQSHSIRTLLIKVFTGHTL
jgi:hypothetical protein